MKLIDADALHKAYMELRNFKQDPQSGDWISLRAVPLTTVIRMLNDAPSIDIVRCRECRYFIDNLAEDDTDEAYGECCFDWDIKMPKADDFCSYGERESE